MEGNEVISVLKITDWNRLYENHRTRILKRMEWVPITNKMDGDGYTELMNHPQGATHFGVWCALLQVASRCEPRGTLIRTGGAPHDPESLSRLTRIPAADLIGGIARLLKIGWLETFTGDPAAIRRLPGAFRREHGANPALSGADPALSDLMSPDSVKPLILGHMAFSGADPALSGLIPAFTRRFAADERNGTEWNGMEGNGRNTAQLSTGDFSTGVENFVSSVLKPTIVERKPKTPAARTDGTGREILNPERIAGMRAILRRYMGMESTDFQRKVPPPDDGIVTQCLTAVGLTPLGDVAAFLRVLFQNGQSPRHESGPKSYAWFPAVLTRQYGPGIETPGEPPADCVAGSEPAGTGILADVAEAV